MASPPVEAPRTKAVRSARGPGRRADTADGLRLLLAAAAVGRDPGSGHGGLRAWRVLGARDTRAGGIRYQQVGQCAPLRRRAAAPYPDHRGGRLRHSLVYRREVRDHVVNAGGGEHAENGHTGNDKPQFAALGQGALVPAHQYVQPGSVTKPRTGKFHHKRRMTARSRFEQNHPQCLGIGHVDLFGRGHDGHALDESSGYAASGI